MNSLQECIWTLGSICGCTALQQTVFLSFSTPCFVFFLLFFQYIFSCLRNGIKPLLTMVHHTTIFKYQSEQGTLCTQVFKSRSMTRPPPLPLKKVRGQPVPHWQSSPPPVPVLSLTPLCGLWARPTALNAQRLWTNLDESLFIFSLYAEPNTNISNVLFFEANIRWNIFLKNMCTALARFSSLHCSSSSNGKVLTRVSQDWTAARRSQKKPK